MAPAAGELNSTRRCRALLVTERFPPEPFLVGEIAEEWRRQGRRFDVLTQVPSYPADALYPGFANRLFQERDEGGMRVMRVATVLGYRRSLVRKIVGYLVFAVFTSFVAVVRGCRYRAVYVYQTGPLTQALPAVMLKRLFGCRTVIWTQDIWPDTVFAYGLTDRGIPAAILRAFVRWIYRGFDEIHATSPGFLPLLERQARPGARVRFVPQWAPRGLSSASREVRVPLEPDRLQFTYVGNLGRFQNLENVILAFEQAWRADPRLQLNIVGTGSEAGRLRQLCRKRGIEGVVFWGQQPQEDVRAWLRASQALVLPLAGQTALAHTIPAKFQAYLRACRPLLVAAVGEVARITREEDLGIVVEPDRVDDIADAFARLASLSAAQRRHIKDRIAAYDAAVFDRSHLLDTITTSVFS